MTTTTTIVRNALGAGLVVLGLWLGVATASQATETVVYYHTDALGSPVAVTDAGGAVIEHRTYEPYGKQLSPLPPQDGPGYTGHVYDAATGLDYMQQRYYDPMIGRMLSRDPVTAYDSGDMRHFNAYAYANDNPYRFTDPDGRESGAFYTQERYQMAMPTDTQSANIGVAAALIIYGGAPLIDSGAATATVQVIKTRAARMCLAGALSLCGVDPATIKNPGKFERLPDGQVAEDVSRFADMMRRLLERLRKADTEIHPPKPPKPPVPPKPPEPRVPPKPELPKPPNTDMPPRSLS